MRVKGGIVTVETLPMGRDSSRLGGQVIRLIPAGEGDYRPQYDDPLVGLVESIRRGMAHVGLDNEPIDQTAEENPAGSANS